MKIIAIALAAMTATSAAPTPTVVARGTYDAQYESIQVTTYVRVPPYARPVPFGRFTFHVDATLGFDEEMQVVAVMMTAEGLGVDGVPRDHYPVAGKFKTEFGAISMSEAAQVLAKKMADLMNQALKKNLGTFRVVPAEEVYRVPGQSRA